ncbi:hypothetical protein D3C76_1151030 [compost metagenome]
MLFTHHKVHGQIALARFTQTPVGQQLQTGKLARTQLPGIGDFAPGIFRIENFLTTLLGHTAFVERRIQPTRLFGLFHQLAADRQQVKYIGGRIIELTLGQRTGQPVGA